MARSLLEQKGDIFSRENLFFCKNKRKHLFTLC